MGNSYIGLAHPVMKKMLVYFHPMNTIVTVIAIIKPSCFMGVFSGPNLASYRGPKRGPTL